MLSPFGHAARRQTRTSSGPRGRSVWTILHTARRAVNRRTRPSVLAYLSAWQESGHQQIQLLNPEQPGEPQVSAAEDWDHGQRNQFWTVAVQIELEHVSGAGSGQRHRP